MTPKKLRLFLALLQFTLALSLIRGSASLQQENDASAANTVATDSNAAAAAATATAAIDEVEDDSEDDEGEDGDDADGDVEENDGTWKSIVEDEDEIGYGQSLIVDIPALASLQSSFQHIEVYNSDHYGKVFVLDDCLQLTERDAPHYNEMLAHVPVMEYLARRRSGDDEPLRVLVVGGGDGYVVSELLKYPQIGTIDHVDLDEDIVNVSRQYFPWAESAWDDEKVVKLTIGDGAKFVKEKAHEKGYHVIVQDASDPFWLADDGSVHELPSSVLFEESHFRNLYKLLKPNEGVMVMQAETYNIPSNLKSIRKWGNVLKSIGFEKPRYGSISIGTYPTGQIGFFVAHARADGRKVEVCQSNDCGEYTMDPSPGINWGRIVDQYNEMKGETLYYHPRIHRSAFDLPLWVEEVIYGKDAIVLPASESE